MEKINVAELLRNCPHGMELNSPAYNNLYFDSIIDSDSYPIKCYTAYNGMLNAVFFTKYGEIRREENAKCVIFPPEKTTWEGFQRPFKDGDIVYFENKYDHKYIGIFKNIEGNYLTNYIYFGADSSGIWSDSSGIWSICFSESFFHVDNIRGQRLATEEEKEKLFKIIKDHGRNWNAETKTLEKLIEQVD